MVTYTYRMDSPVPATIEERKLMEKEAEVRRREAELKQLEEAGAKTVYKEGLPRDLARTSVPVTQAEWRARIGQYQTSYAAYEQAYRQYLAAHRYQQAQQIKAGIRQKQQYELLKQKQEEQQSLPWWKKPFAEASKPFSGWEAVPSERPIGEQKAWKAFGQPSWKETTIAGWFYSTGERMKATGHPVMQSLAAGPIQFAGLIAPFEGLFRPEIPTASSALITSAQESIRLHPFLPEGPPLLDSAPRFLAPSFLVPRFWVQFQPQKSETMEEFEGLDPQFGQYAIAGEIALAWLTGKAFSKGTELLAKTKPGQWVARHTPEALKNIFVRQDKSFTIDLVDESETAEQFVKSSLYKKGAAGFTYQPTSYSSKYVSPEAFAKTSLYKKGLASKALPKTIQPIQRTPMHVTLSKAIQLGEQKARQEAQKQAYQQTVRTANQAIFASQAAIQKQSVVGTLKTITKPRSTASVLPLVGKSLMQAWTGKPYPKTERQTREQVEYVHYTMPEDMQSLMQGEKPTITTRYKTSTRAQLRVDQPLRILPIPETFSLPKPVSRTHTDLMLRPLLPLIQFPTQPIRTGTSIVQPPLFGDPPKTPSPRIPSLYPKKPHARKEKGWFGGRWTLNLWPVRTISSYEDLRKVVGI